MAKNSHGLLFKRYCQKIVRYYYELVSVVIWNRWWRVMLLVLLHLYELWHVQPSCHLDL